MDNNNQQVTSTEPVVNTEPVQVEQKPEKKKDGSVLGTIFAFAFLFMIIFGFLNIEKFNKYINEHFPEIGKKVGIDKDDTEEYVVEENKLLQYAGYYKTTYVDENNTNHSESIILRGDGVFVYDNDLEECYDPLVGTYSVNETFSFVGKIKYMCIECYLDMDESIKNFEGTYDNNTLTIDGHTFTKDNSYRETNSDIKKYAIKDSTINKCDN